MRRNALLFAALIPALILSGCGSSASTDKPSDDPAATSADAAGFPMTIDSCGTPITLDKPAERLYSGNREMTHTLMALGLTDQIVGAAPFLEAPPEQFTDDAAKINTIKDASTEAVLDLDPDLLVASFDIFQSRLTNREMFDKLGIPFYISPTECTGKEMINDSDAAERDQLLGINVFYTEIEQLAAMTGHPERGTDLVAEMKDRLANATTKDFSDVTAMVWYYNTESPTVAGCCGASGIIMDQLGVTNVFEDQKSEWPAVGWEDIALRNPDVIILGDMNTVAENVEFLKTDPLTKNLDAVINERYYVVPTSALVSSVSMVYAVEDVADAMEASGLGK